MIADRQRLHDLVDIVDADEIDVLYRVLLRFVPEDEATPDEVEAMQIGRDEITRGEYVRHEDIDWN